MNEIQCLRIERHIIEPLRSGRYVQGRGKLEYTTSDGAVRHCCLGVATREAIAAGCEIRNIATVSDGDQGVITVFDGSSGFLPDSVREWYGLPEEPGLPMPNMKRVSPVALNDGDNVNEIRPHTFDEIADAFQRLVDENRAMRAKHELADL